MARPQCGAGSARVMRGATVAEVDEPLEAREGRHEIIWTHVENNPQT